MQHCSVTLDAKIVDHTQATGDIVFHRHCHWCCCIILPFFPQQHLGHSPPLLSLVVATSNIMSIDVSPKDIRIQVTGYEERRDGATTPYHVRHEQLLVQQFNHSDNRWLLTSSLRLGVFDSYHRKGEYMDHYQAL
jgi:hypothetical protein